MAKKGLLRTVIILGVLMTLALPALAAYKAHDNDYDTEQFLTAYPEARYTKLDNCYLCHSGGQSGKNYLNSCDWCHEVYGLKPPFGDIEKTLTSYGRDYRDAGRNAAACLAISHLDSDGDGFTNAEEIAAIRLPGDANDNPNVPEAPGVIFTREDLRKLPRVNQFMLLDTSKSGDYYATYSGVDIYTLLQAAGIRDDAVDITVFAADGYSRSFSLEALKKSYPQGTFETSYPWVQFPENAPYVDGQQIPGELRYILAYEKDGYPLLTSRIVADERGIPRLDGEGPYRFISPLSEPVVADRSSRSIDRIEPPYPYNPDRSVVRNADYCIKSVVAIRVNTADNKSMHYDWAGQAWKMIEEGKLLIYGAIDPR